MLPISLHMGRAILIETYTNAPYRPGHWLLCDVTPEPQVYRPSPLPPSPLPLPSPSPLSLLVPVWQQAPLSLATHSQSCTFHPSLVHFTPWPISGGALIGYLAGEGHYPVCDWGRGPGEDR